MPTFTGDVALALASVEQPTAALLGTLTKGAGTSATFEGLVVAQPGVDFTLVTRAGTLEEGHSEVFAATLDDVHCVGDEQCSTGVCREGLCVPAECDDGVVNGGESGVDCGGESSCELCEVGFGCTRGADCDSGVCGDADVCLAAACDDGVANGAESGIDCGGGSTCGLCEAGLGCTRGDDCASGVCGDGVCFAPTCNDGVANGLEGGVDCGGASACELCADGAACGLPSDCLSGVCSAEGVCAAPSCSDATSNGGESGVDCGGASPCGRCGTGGGCTQASDCVSGVCGGDVCLAPACNDGVLNGGEAEIDCGGTSSCGACAVVCDGPEDCGQAACAELPLCSLVGTWDVESPSGTAYITFLEDGTYLHAEHSNSDTNGQNGIEVGTYSWTRATGAFATTCPTVDTNREWGMSHGGGGLSCANGGSGTSGTLELRGDALTLTLSDGSFDAARVVPPRDIVGTWRPVGAAGFPFITFAADGTYVHAEYGNSDPNGQPGIEAGTYTWNDATGAFRSLCPPIDTNGEWGLSHTTGQGCTGATGTITVAGDVITITFGAETFTATRVVAVAP